MVRIWKPWERRTDELWKSAPARNKWAQRLLAVPATVNQEIWGTRVIPPYLFLSKVCHTVDGRNSAPPGMYETLQIMGYLPYHLVQDFWTINSITISLRNRNISMVKNIFRLDHRFGSDFFVRSFLQGESLGVAAYPKKKQVILRAKRKEIFMFQPSIFGGVCCEFQGG